MIRRKRTPLYLLGAGCLALTAMLASDCSTQAGTSASSTSGTLSFPYLAADAGNYSMQAGEQITIIWQDAPGSAQSYEIDFIGDDGSTQRLSAVLAPMDPEIGAAWFVPPGASGRLEGIARYRDGRVVRSRCCAQVHSGELPPEGICSLRTRGITPQHLYAEPDLNSSRILGLAPGLYLEVLDRSPDGWYRVRIPAGNSNTPPSSRSTTGWLFALDGVATFGPCDEISGSKEK